jgi:membrane protease YdiL (CAAX protease family)
MPSGRGLCGSRPGGWSSCGWSSGRWGIGLIVALGIATVAGTAVAQTIDTAGVTSMKVEDVVGQMQQHKLWILLISNALVVALLFAGGLLSPGGFAKAGLRDVTGLPAALWVFAGVVVYLAWVSAAGVVSESAWLREGSLTEFQQSVVVSLCGFLFGVVAGLGMLLILRRSAPEAGLKLSWLDAPVGLGCFMLAYPFIELAAMTGVALHTQLSEGAAPPAIAHDMLRTLVDSPNDAWVWAWVIGGGVIGAPFVEEVIYRVFLQGAILRITRSPWISILITSILFAMMHRLGEQPVPWHALLPIFAVGIACGVGYERTKRVGVPITMHLCFNALNVILALIVGPENAAPAV